MPMRNGTLHKITMPLSQKAVTMALLFYAGNHAIVTVFCQKLALDWTNN